MVRLVRPYLVLLAIVCLVFGFLYLFTPDLLTDATGFGDLAPEAVTDVRATYGGLQLALGLFFMWSSRDSDRYRNALTLAVIMFVCIAGSRTIGLLIDREPTPAMVSAAFVEGAWGALSAWFLSKQHVERG
jgi:nitrate reductase gamma subunit